MSDAADVLMSVFGLVRACTHGRGPASQCSQCLGAEVRKVTVVDGALCIDGVPTGRGHDAPKQVTARRTALQRRRKPWGG